MKRSLAISEQAANAAEHANKLSRDTYIANHRPWVSVIPEIGGPLYYNENGLNITIRFHLKNTGNSPALNVFPYMELRAPAMGIDKAFNPESILKDLIDSNKKNISLNFGLTLFPGELVTQDMSASISKEELTRITTNIKYILPNIFVVVNYRFAFSDSESHQTAFILDMQQLKYSNEKPPRLIPLSIFVEDGDIPPEKLLLEKTLIFGGHTD